MATKSNPGQFDCYSKAAPDEPMFTLLGRDRHAPTLVRIWSLLRARDVEDEAKIAEALACADAMEGWNRIHGRLPLGDTEAVFERLLLAASEGLDEHPDDYAHACTCSVCLSYGEPAEGEGENG